MAGLGGKSAFKDMTSSVTHITNTTLIQSLDPAVFNVTPGYIDLSRVISAWEIYDTTPTLTFTESDQTDPAGRYRFYSTAGTFILEMAKTASWATADTILTTNILNAYVGLSTPNVSNWYLSLTGGLSYTKNASIKVGTITTGGADGIEIRTGNGTSSNAVRMQIGTGASTVDVAWASAVHSGLTFKSTTYASSGAIRTDGAALLNKTTPALAMTLANADVTGKLLIISQIDSGTVGHTVTTATAGGFDGTNNTATFNAQYDSLILYSIGVARWIILENLGVVLSAV